MALLKDNEVNYTKSCFIIPQRDALWIIITLLFFVYIEFDLNTVQFTEGWFNKIVIWKMLFIWSLNTLQLEIMKTNVLYISDHFSSVMKSLTLFQISILSKTFGEWWQCVHWLYTLFHSWDKLSWVHWRKSLNLCYKLAKCDSH